MPLDIVGLRQDRAKAYEGLNAILTATDGRAMTAEEQAQFDTAEASVKDFDAKIKNAERVQALRANTAVPSRASVADEDRGA